MSASSFGPSNGQPSLLLARAAFVSVSPAELGFACLYGLGAVAAALLWASRALDRFVVRGELRQ